MSELTVSAGTVVFDPVKVCAAAVNDWLACVPTSPAAVVVTSTL